MMEILAPVGGAEQLRAAVFCGADAVYLGGKGFNARRNAENFGELGLAEAVRFCHAHGVKVHVTVNTLVQDKERAALVDELHAIADAGADAVIVQDLAVAALWRECCPDMPLHASTQMVIHGVDGARAARELGFSRIVPARELSLPEIRSLCETGLEVECFVHGALCMSVSGGCYLSAMLGGRSGNRGLCAQPCRLDFTAPDGRAYALSLKDMSHIEHIADLREAGVCSLKIEGRMKRPEYVAAAVTACRAALSGEKPDMAALEAVFSRSGFTDGYLTGKRGRQMFGYRRREDVEAASGVLAPLAELYRAEPQNVPVDISLKLAAGEPVSLSITDGQERVEVTGGEAQVARNRPTDEETARKYLSRTGGTPFCLHNIELIAEEGLMVPPSVLNDLRRRATEALYEKRAAGAPRPFVEPKPPAPQKYSPPERPQYRLRFDREEQIFPGAGEHTLILPLYILEKNPDLCKLDNLIGELPALCFPSDLEALEQRLLALKERGLRRLLCGTIGALHLALRLGFCAHGGHGLNVLNSASLAEYARLGLSDATLSFELNMRDAARLGGSLPRGIIAYGRLPLMNFRNCPARGERGCGDCEGRPSLRDRKGVDFPLRCGERKYVTLHNSLPLHIADKNIAPLDFLTLYFTDESAEVCRRVLREYEERRPSPEPRTGGLYYRELL